jgi:hypothetical protein
MVESAVRIRQKTKTSSFIALISLRMITLQSNETAKQNDKSCFKSTFSLLKLIDFFKLYRYLKTATFLTLAVYSRKVKQVQQFCSLIPYHAPTALHRRKLQESQLATAAFL